MSNTLTYDGRGGKLFAIMLVNLLLSIVTFGIYSFWGKTRTRRYIISSITFNGDRLEYTGTGLELFLGFLKVTVIFTVLSLAVFGAFYALVSLEAAIVLSYIVFYIILFPLSYMAVYLALRYRYSRTRWRGIRGKLTGSAWGYAWRMILYLFGTIFTLGVIKPFADVASFRYIYRHSYVGSEKVEFDGDAGGSLFTTHIVTLLLFPFTLGISRFWYMAALMRVHWNHLRMQKAQFSSYFSGGSMFGLFITNLLLIVCTLGIAIPFAQNRVLHYVVGRLHLQGDEIDSAAILQSDQKLGKTGEGLAQNLGSDLGLDIGM